MKPVFGLCSTWSVESELIDDTLRFAPCGQKLFGGYGGLDHGNALSTLTAVLWSTVVYAPHNTPPCNAANHAKALNRAADGAVSQRPAWPSVAR